MATTSKYLLGYRVIDAPTLRYLSLKKNLPTPVPERPTPVPLPDALDILYSWQDSGYVAFLTPVLRKPAAPRAPEVPFRVQKPEEIQAFWKDRKDAKSCTAPTMRLLGVTDGTIVHWCQLTRIEVECLNGFRDWWRSLPEAKPYARFKDDHS